MKQLNNQTIWSRFHRPVPSCCLLLSRLLCKLFTGRGSAETLELDELFTSSRDGIFVVDGRGSLLRANAAFCRMLGYKLDELTALKSFDDITPEKWRQWEADDIRDRRLLRDGYSGLYEKEYIRKDGRVFPVEVQSFLFFNHDRTPRYIWAIVRDITERVKAEAEKSLLEGSIRNKQRLETIGTLAGGIAHDFNNILVPVLGYAELSLSALSTEDPLYDNLNEIIKAAERAKNLVGRILTFSRPSEVNPEFVPVPVQSLVKEALTLLRPALPAAVALETHIDSSCRNVLADASQIHQVVVNLCTNAFHAMEERGGVLRLELREVSGAEDIFPASCNTDTAYLALSVSDTGTGMDEATLERIFEPFFTTKPVNKGTGLGLSVVYGIVKNCKGEITVESAAGKGSTFRIFLPVIDEKAAESRPSADPVQGGGRILFVDDEPAAAKLMFTALSKLGYETVTENAPARALELLKAEPEKFDLVITDLSMPEMTGLELAAAIHQARPDLPVILLTGYGQDIDQAQPPEHYGIRQVLIKPVKLNVLASSIYAIINQQEEVV